MKRHQKREAERFEKVTVGSVHVKVYTRQRAGGYTVHEVADYSKGHRRLRSFSDHTKAIAEAERIARLMAAGEAHAAQMSGTDAASYGRGVELLRPTRTPIELACARYAEAVQILGGDGDRLIEAVKHFVARGPGSKRPRRTVAEVRDELIAQREAAGRAPRSLLDLRSRLGKFAEAFSVDIGSVTTADVQTWLDGMRKKPQTVSNYRRVVGGLFTFAERRGYIERGSNPVSFTEQPETKRRGKISVYTAEEFRKLLDAASEQFRVYLALAGLAGLRPESEIQRLDWSNVDLVAGHIEVAADKTKTASRRLVPICPALSSWLAPHSKSSGPVWAGTGTDARDARQETAKAAGVPWKPNALRHTFISCRLAEVQNAAQVALEAGNSATMIFRHYRELTRPADAKAWFAVSPEQPANVTRLEVSNG